ncbi:MAG: U32 family peptidase, partial [Mogibacterium sp.]|nr:U32 family peptidase [Mogibacterium sp.]
MTDRKDLKLELLAPAGDMEKLRTAILFGADAVYFGGQIGSLRAGAGNLSVDEIREAMDFIHDHGCKGYMTLNIYAHNDDIPVLRDYIVKIKDIQIDEFLVSDPGVMGLIKEQIPDAEIHLSTQANTTTYLTAAFWVNQGVKRIVAAREMSLAELTEMRRQLPEDIEIEAFMHGAMCISYSGICLLSNFLEGRDANRGACTHPCRWKYSLVEEQRPGEYYPI